MLTRLWINLPIVLFGILSFIAAFLVLMLPETLNKTLPQTIEDTEQMGLSWYEFLVFYLHLFCLFIFSIRVRGISRTSKREVEMTNKDDQDPTEDQLLTERLKEADEH
jgi:hypothetical protein